jgi:hypothetical protein
MLALWDTVMDSTLSPWRVWRIFVMVSSAPAPIKELVLISLKEPLPAEDEPLSDVDVMIRSPLSRKRTHHSSSDTTISAEVPDVTLEPELEDPL